MSRGKCVCPGHWLPAVHGCCIILLPRFYLDTNTGDVVVELASRRVRSACPERVDSAGVYAGVWCAHVGLGLLAYRPLLATAIALYNHSYWLVPDYIRYDCSSPSNIVHSPTRCCSAVGGKLRRKTGRRYVLCNAMSSPWIVGPQKHVG